jgi:hypothetical protein
VSLNPRHVENVVEQVRKAIELSQCNVGLLPPLSIGMCVGQVADGDADGGQRRTKVVAQRREQRRGERAARRVARATLSRRRELTADHCNNEKHDQRDPIRRIGDGQGAHRRHEEEVEQQRRADSRHHRHPEAAKRSNT